MSVASADCTSSNGTPIICYGTNETADQVFSINSGLTWNGSSGGGSSSLWTLQNTSSGPVDIVLQFAASAPSQPTENLDGTTYTVTMGGNVTGVSKPILLLKSDKGIDMQNKTLTFDFGGAENSGVANVDGRKMQLDLTNAVGTAFMGDINIKAGRARSWFGENQFEATFGGDVIGNITVQNNGGYNDIVASMEFQNSATLQGSLILSATGSASGTTITGLGGITGDITISAGTNQIGFVNDSTYAGTTTVSGGTTTVNGLTTLRGNIIRTTGSNNGTITFATKTDMIGNITRTGGLGNTSVGDLIVNFNNGSTLTGNIQTGISGNGNDYSANKVTFAGGQADINVLTGNIISYGTGTNSGIDNNNGNFIVFTNGSMYGEIMSTTTGAPRMGRNQVSFEAADEAQTLAGSITTTGGKNIVNFSGSGDKKIEGNITANANAYNNIGYNNVTFTSTGKNTIAGNILATYNSASQGGRNTITFSAGTNRIEGTIESTGKNYALNSIMADNNSASLTIVGKIITTMNSNYYDGARNEVTVSAGDITIQNADEDANVIVAGGGINTFNFSGSGSASIIGDISATSSGAGGVGENNLTFATTGNNSINGNILSNQGNNNITFSSASSSTTNTIQGNITSQQTKNTIDFTSNGTNSIIGDISSHSSNVITFDGSGTNTITGNISSNVSGVNTITVTAGNTLSINNSSGDTTYTISAQGGHSSSNTITADTLNIGNTSLVVTGNSNSSNKNIITASVEGNLNFTSISASSRANNANEITINGGTLTVSGNISANSGTNTFTSSATTNSFANIASSSGTNTITLNNSVTGTVTGDITNNAGQNKVITDSGTLELTKDGASIFANGGGTATNTITAATLNITNAALSANGNGNGNNDNYITATNTGTITLSTIAVNGGNDNNSNVIYLANGALKVTGDITATRGKNILNNAAGTVTLGDASADTAISITAGNAQNILSIGSATNTLTLASVSTNNANGRNYLAKNIVTGSTATDSGLVSNFESAWASSSYQANGSLSTTEDITATNGKNYINIASVTIGGNLSVSGGSASNNIATDTLTTKAISSTSGGVNNLISSGTSSVGGDISVAGNGKNYPISSGVATLGNGEAIAITADAGQNIVSIDNSGSNVLKLSSLTTGSGHNYIAKTVVTGAETGALALASNLTTNSYFSDDKAFNGQLSISAGVSGNNTISYKASSSQTSAVISNLADDSSARTLALGTAVSGSNNIYLNVSESGIQSAIGAMTSQDPADYKNSSVILGHVQNSGTTNIKIVGTPNQVAGVPGGISTHAESDKAQIGILGNINNTSGTLNVVLQDTFFAPSAIVIGTDGSTKNTVSVGGTEAGNITTASGATTNIVTRFTNSPSSSGASMYNISGGGTTNVVLQGNVNVGTNIDYTKGSAINLIFANANNITSGGVTESFEGEHTNLAGKESQVLGVTYQDGVELAIADKTVLIGDTQASFLETYSSYYTDGSTPLATVTTDRVTDLTKDTINIQGLVVGDIYSLTNGTSSKTYDVTLNTGAAFAGSINLDASTTSAVNIVMNEGSKLILADASDSALANNFVISTLDITGGAVDVYQLQNETLKQSNTVINIATGGASANNVASREAFRLLTIGSDQSATQGTGLTGSGEAVFMTYVNTNANQNTATLGGVSSSGKTPVSRASGVTEGQYGNLYSDRIIIANIGNNQTAQTGTYYMQFAVDADSKLGSVTYNASNDQTSGGVKTAGNIAVLTVVNTGTDSKTAGINLKTQDVLQGFDQIGGDLIAVETDINGEAGSGKTGYTTYFINNLTTRGATEATQEVTASAFATNYDLYMANFNSLNKRMGELRDNNNSQGAWARVFSGAQSNDFSKSKSTYTTIQGGYDYALGMEGANNYIGLAVSYSMSSSKSDLSAIDINGSTKGIEDIKSSAVEVAIYNAYVQDEGWYNDSIAKFSYIMSDFKMIGQNSTYSTNNMAFTLSDEFGYRFKLGEAKEWTIDPQLEVAFGYFNQSDFVQKLGLSSLEGVAEGILTTRARFGSSFGYDFKKFTENKPIKASVYVGAFYEYDYVMGGDVTLTTNLGGETVSSSAISSDGRVVMNVGTNMTVKDNTRIYFDFETSFAGKITTDYQVNVGVRYSFGENTGYTPLDPNKKSITPLKVSDESEETQESVENTQEQTSEANKESANSTEDKTEESTEVKSEEKAQ